MAFPAVRALGTSRTCSTASAHLSTGGHGRFLLDRRARCGGVVPCVGGGRNRCTGTGRWTDSGERARRRHGCVADGLVLGAVHRAKRVGDGIDRRGARVHSGRRNAAWTASSRVWRRQSGGTSGIHRRFRRYRFGAGGGRRRARGTGARPRGLVQCRARRTQGSAGADSRTVGSRDSPGEAAGLTEGAEVRARHSSHAARRRDWLGLAMASRGVTRSLDALRLAAAYDLCSHGRRVRIRAMQRGQRSRDLRRSGGGAARVAHVGGAGAAYSRRSCAAVVPHCVDGRCRASLWRSGVYGDGARGSGSRRAAWVKRRMGGRRQPCAGRVGQSILAAGAEARVAHARTQQYHGGALYFACREALNALSEGAELSHVGRHRFSSGARVFPQRAVKQSGASSSCAPLGWAGARVQSAAIIAVCSLTLQPRRWSVAREPARWRCAEYRPLNASTRP